MYIYPLSHRQYVYVMLMARTSNEITKIIIRDCILDAMLRDVCGKGRVGLYQKVSMIEQQTCTHIYTKLYITMSIHVHISLHFYLYCLLLDSNPVFLHHY